MATSSRRSASACRATARNSGPRWLISPTDAPLSPHSSMSACAWRRTDSGRAAGPGLKLYARAIVLHVSVGRGILVCRSATVIPAAPAQLFTPCGVQASLPEETTMSLRSVLAIPASDVTDETVYRARRRLLGAFAGASLLPLAGCAEAEAPPSTAVVTPAQARSGFRTDEVQTRYEDITGYTNCDEFGTDKADPSRADKTLRTSPWNIAVSGECDKPGNLSFEDLLKGITPEERIYRLRCVEGWSMVIPWLGVPLAQVLRKFAPTSKARYVAFTTLADPAQMPGLRFRAIDWPYR